MSCADLFGEGGYFGLALTVLVYWASSVLWQRSGRAALLHPILISTLFIAAVLMVFDCGYDGYSAQSRPLMLGLGLVVVLLAVPLARNRAYLLASVQPCWVALAVGAAVSIVATLALPLSVGADPSVIPTLLPKSATAGVAVGISAEIGGLPGLTAVIVIGTSVVGASLGPAVLDLAGVADDRARGFALGVASHAIGTARALQISDTAGAFAALGMVLNALLTVLLAPIVMMLITP